jgi:predicted MFS family arabinose efflux permease
VANANPASVRTKALSVFRFWRDLGYVMGALLAGLIADWVGMELSFVTVGALTLLSTTWLIRNEYQNKKVT